MLRKGVQFGACIASLMVVAGCGKSPASPLLPTVPAAPSQLPAPVASPGADAGHQEGDVLLAQVRAAFAGCTGAEAEARSYSEGHFKAGAHVGELRHATYRTRMVWMKPHKMLGEVLETDNFLVGGAKMTTLDGQNVRVKGAGLLGLFPLTLQADSDMLSSNRHHKFSDQSPDAICRRLLGPAVHWTVLGAATVAGKSVRLIALDGAPHLDAEITREVIAIDPQDAGLRGVTMYAGTRKVEDVTFTSFRWNPKPAADTFSP
jgi:hypothetical protein